MSVLVTHVAGPLGREVAQKFLGEGHSVVGLDPLTEYALEDVPVHPDFSFKGLGPLALKRVPDGVACLVHCPTFRGEDLSYTLSEAAHLALLFAGRRALCFSVLLDMFWLVSGYTAAEVTKPCPIQYRARMARLVEQVFRSLAPETVVLRAGELYQDTQSTLGVMLERARSRKPCRIENGGRDVEPRLCVEDAADAAYLAFAKHGHYLSDVFHLHDGMQTTQTFLLEALESLQMVPDLVEYSSERWEPRRAIFDLCEVAEDQLGWAPKGEVREFLRQARQTWTGGE